MFKLKLEVSHEYPVHFTRNIFSRENPILAKTLGEGARVLVLVDDGVSQAHPQLEKQIVDFFAEDSGGQLLAKPMSLLGGEECKGDREALFELYRVFAEYHLDRHSIVLAIGGGAFLDFVGFATATAHRGLQLLRMPTTVLAQNDAGLGVKNGVNFLSQKNFVGTFATPIAVINDFNFLKTLCERDLRSGIAEAIKVALIRDRDFFIWLEEKASQLSLFSELEMEKMIQWAGRLHLEHIATSGDPFERGVSRPLDFGHWAAHKLEGLSQHRIRHGEAVAVGVAMDTFYSYVQNWITEDECLRIIQLLKTLGFPLWYEELEKRDYYGNTAIYKGIEEFREHIGGELSLCMLQGVGQSFDVHTIDETVYSAAISFLRQVEGGYAGQTWWKNSSPQLLHQYSPR